MQPLPERHVGPSLARRLLITLLLPSLLVAASGWITLPGVDRNAFDAMLHRGIFTALSGGSLHNVSVFALGVMPILTAYGIVELAAIIVPRWRRLRHVDPAGRAKLERAARVVALLLAALQAYGVAKSLEELSASPLGVGDVVHTVGIRSTIVIVASLVAGLCVTFIVAEIVTRQGIANGLLVILLVEEIDAVRTSVLQTIVQRLKLQDLAPLSLLGGFLVVVVTIIAAWLALRPDDSSGTTKPEGDRGYRDAARGLAVRPWIPIPASALVPLPIASSLLMTPSMLALLFHAQDPWSVTASANRWVSLAANLVLTLVLAFFIARLIHRPRDMADVATRLGAGSKAELETEAHAALRRVLPATMLFLATLIIAHAASAALPLGGFSITFWPLAVAVLLDARGSIRTLRTEPNLVSVWTERRISVVPVLRAVLEADGITVRTRGDAVLSLLQVFGPYAPVEILVREADAKRASELLRHLLLGDEAPAPEPRDAASASPTPVAAPLSTRVRTIGLVVMAVLAGGILALATVRIPSRAARSEVLIRPKLELVMVYDDGPDPFERVREANVPSTIELRTESVPVGIDAYGQKRMAKRTYATSKLGPDESRANGARRLEQWLATVPAPPGTRFVLQETEDYDADTGKATIDGYRSMLVYAKADLHTEDVEEAVASMDMRNGLEEVYVSVTLSRKGADRFEELTAANVNRRLAILIDGKVTSAPVIRSKIGGGRLSITMGAGDFEQQRTQAQDLAKRLNGR